MEKETKQKEYKNEIMEINSDVNPVPKSNIPNAFLMFQTVSSAPTAVPLTWQNQIQIYVNGATKRIYIFDNVAGVWSYSALT